MPESNARPGIKLKLWCCLLGIILTAVGLFFAIAGGKLVSLGGQQLLPDCWYRHPTFRSAILPSQIFSGGAVPAGLYRHTDLVGVRCRF